MRGMIVLIVLFAAFNEASAGAERLYPASDSAKKKPKTFRPLKRCDETVVWNVQNRLIKGKSLSYDTIRDFLYAYDKSCNINVELSEAMSELIFKVVENAPELVIKALAQEKDMQIDYIIEELSDASMFLLWTVEEKISPKSRNYEAKLEKASKRALKKIYERVSNARGDDIVKKRILNALKKSMTEI